MINKYKVLVSYVKGISDYPDNIILKPFIAKPGEVCKEQYLVLDWFNTEKEARRFIKYIETKLVRFLIALRKISKHNTTTAIYLFPARRTLVAPTFPEPIFLISPRPNTFGIINAKGMEPIR